MSKNLFEIASRARWRFQTPAGLLPVEELWHIALIDAKVNVPNLNVIAQGLSKQIKAQGEETENFVNPTSKAGATKLQLLQDQLEVVKYIINVRLEENKAAEEVAERRAKNAKIREIMAQRKDKALENMTDAELEKLLAD